MRGSIISAGFKPPPMLGFSCVEEIGSAAILAVKRLAAVTPEMNLREHVTFIPLSNMNKAAHSGFKT